MVLLMISVVIPTLDAAATLPRCLDSLASAQASGFVEEVIVADGGSADATIALADAAGARIVRAERGRGPQLAAGADAAREDWLLFLHADTALEAGWEQAAAQFAAQSHGACAGYFRFALDDSGTAARRLERLVAWRCRWFALPYGDQALLIPRPLYDLIGGYRPLPLMEDVDVARRLGRRRLAGIQCRAVTSAERFRREGYLRRPARNLTILALFACRVPVRILSTLYR